LSTYTLGEGVWAHGVAVAPSGVVVVAAEDALGGTGGRAGVFGPDGAAVLTRDGPYTGADLSPDGAVAALCGGALELVDAAEAEELGKGDSVALTEAEPEELPTGDGLDELVADMVADMVAVMEGVMDDDDDSSTGA
jgi:hypothetical protein